MQNSSRREQVRQAAQRRRQLRQRRRRVLVSIAGLTIFTVLAAGLAALLTQGGGDPDASGSNRTASWNTPAFAGGARLAVDQPTQDFGSVAYRHEVQATYRLKNVGDQPLEIQNPEVLILDGC